MSSQPLMQLSLFAVEKRPDGTVLLTPRRFVSAGDIGVQEACRLLGVDRETIYRLIGLGAIRAWRVEGRRTKYRIDADSVLEYKARRQAAALF